MVERIVVGSMYTNAYIYSEWKKECILIDPGDDHEEIIRHLTLKNLVPRGIALTHGHLDHISAISPIQDYFAEKEIKLPIAVHKKDKQFLGKNAEQVHRKNFNDLGLNDDTLFNSIFTDLPPADIFLDEGDYIFDSDLVVIHTPGHTAGSLCFYSESQGILFSGDTLFFEGIGRTDLPEGNMEKILSSIKKKLFTLPELTRIFPGHGPDTTLEREIRHNPFV